VMSDTAQLKRFDYILKLEADNREQRLKHDLAITKRKIKQETLNAQINIITAQVSIVVCAAFGGVEL